MLDIENSIVIAIDIQEKLVNAVAKHSPVEQACKIVQTAKILDIPVIVTEQYPQGLGATVFDFKECLGENTSFFEKTAFSALCSDELKEKLTNSNRKQVILFGIEAHICVYQTACDLIAQGYEVYIVKDASASRNKYEFKTGIELLKQIGAKITCTEIVLFELLKTSKNPNFKAIQALIK